MFINAYKETYFCVSLFDVGAGTKSMTLCFIDGNVSLENGPLLATVANRHHNMGGAKEVKW